MERISGFQLILMGVILTFFVSLINVPAQAMGFARQHVYIPYLLSFGILLLLLWMIAKVSARFPDKDLFESLIERFPLAGRAIAGFYLLFLFILLARDLRILTDFTNIFLLHTTPLAVLASLYVIPVILLVRGGIEVLGRATELFTPILILVTFSIPFLMAKEINPAFFEPLFDVHWKGVGISLWYVVAYMGEIMLMPFLFSKRTFQFRHGLFALCVGSLLLLTVVLFELLVLGIHLTPRMYYPAYALIRQIQVTDFLDRFELLMVALYFPSVMLKMAYSLHLVCYGLNKMNPNFSAKFFAAPIGILGMVCSFWFYGDIMQLVELNGVWPVFALSFIVVIPMLLFFIMRPKEDENSKPAA